MSRIEEFETTVCNGFPVRVRCTVQRAEPDVGIDREFGEDFEIMTVRGDPAPWIEKKMTDDDWVRVNEDIPSEGGW